MEVIARDRASAYAEGARQGGPGTMQVADRFYVLRNLKELLDHVFTLHEKTLNAVNTTLRPPPVPLVDRALASTVTRRHERMRSHGLRRLPGSLSVESPHNPLQRKR